MGIVDAVADVGGAKEDDEAAENVTGEMGRGAEVII